MYTSALQQSRSKSQQRLMVSSQQSFDAIMTAHHISLGKTSSKPVVWVQSEAMRKQQSRLLILCSIKSGTCCTVVHGVACRAVAGLKNQKWLTTFISKVRSNALCCLLFILQLPAWPWSLHDFIHCCHLIHQVDQLYEDHADVDAATEDLLSLRPPLLLHVDASNQMGQGRFKVSWQVSFLYHH